MSGYKRIKQLAKDTGTPIPDLLALHRKNDPFFVGSPTQTAQAQWFAALWERFGYTTRVHLRRVHYRLVHHEAAPTKHDGTPYLNTEGCWDYLCNAGKYARILGLVGADAFVDRRNPRPRVFMPSGPAGEFGEPGWEHEPLEWDLPRLTTDLTSALGELAPALYPTGYEYRDDLQPYLVEIWVEKSTMQDELLPLSARHAANLITGVGFLSITSVVELLARRVRVLDKPCRILYISDFDPAGDQMPVAVARQIEYWLERYAPGADVRLEPTVLTAEQVEHYGLPRTPIKDTDPRRSRFEALYGEGAVELDALEAVRPGELARIVGGRIAELRDADLRRKVLFARWEADDRLVEALTAVASDALDEVEEIKDAAGVVLERYEVRLDRMAAEMERELAPLRARLEVARQAVQDALDSLQPELPGLPKPETPSERDGWLYDAGRDYFQQLAVYKSHHNGEGVA